MSGGITAIQAKSPAETWEAWQALVQVSLGEGGAEGAHAGEAGEAHAAHPLQGATPAHAADGAQPVVAAAMSAEAQPIQMPNALLPTQPSSQGLLSGHAPHAAHHAQPAQPAADAQAQVQAQVQTSRDVPHVAATPPTASADRAQAAAPSPLQAPAPGLLGDVPVAAAARFDAAGAVLPMAPVLMTPLTLQNGPELRWRVQDAASWRALFDNAGRDAAPDDGEAEPEALPAPDAVEVAALPAWAQALLLRLREAATAPASAAAIRPALQAWRVGQPVLLASPAGLASLQPSRDAAVWGWRRWPARWRTARPTTVERWWAVRVGLGAQGHPRTLRELAGAGVLRPGQVSCELRLGDATPGLAQWTEVLVHATTSPSLRSLLGQRPSLTWLLCNQPLWPQEGF